jgi:hypothetical protein
MQKFVVIAEKGQDNPHQKTNGNAAKFDYFKQTYITLLLAKKSGKTAKKRAILKGREKSTKQAPFYVKKVGQKYVFKKS